MTYEHILYTTEGVHDISEYSSLIAMDGALTGGHCNT
jgi:hypothetical protein